MSYEIIRVNNMRITLPLPIKNSYTFIKANGEKLVITPNEDVK